MEKSKILSEIRRVADIVGESPSVPQFNDTSEFTHIVATHEFGSWNEAKEAAGLNVRKRRPDGESKHTLAKEIKIGGSCEFCDEDYYSVLTYHHVDKSEKEMAIAKMLREPYENYNREDVKNEIEKCILVCANCHRKIHSDHELTPGKMETLNV